MKKFLTVILVMMAIGFGVSLMFAAFPSFTVTGTGFFTAIENDQYQEAYNMFDDTFRKEHTLEQFREMIAQVGLDKYKSVEWLKTVADKDKGYAVILGVVTTYDDQTIPVQIRFVKITNESGETIAWLISSLRTHSAANEGLY